MATRYYPSIKAPSVIMHGPMHGNWGVMGVTSPTSPVRHRWILRKTKYTGTLNQTGTYFTSNKQGNYDIAPDWTWTTPPLQAQTISGNLTLMFLLGAGWFGKVSGGIDAPISAKLKLHIYLANGNTVQHKATILDNYIDTTAITVASFGFWTQITTPALTGVTVAAGDVIVIEMGFRIESSPTPVVTYPPSFWSRIELRALSAKSTLADATVADTDNPAKAPWIEFSMNLLEQTADTTPPTNDSCLEAIVIPSLPYTSAFIDSTYSADTDKALWWKYTAEKNGSVRFATHGTNYPCTVWVYTGLCGALVGNHNDGSYFSNGRSYSITSMDVVAGTTYFIKIIEDQNNVGGGVARLTALYIEIPLVDDLYLPS